MVRAALVICILVIGAASGCFTSPVEPAPGAIANQVPAPAESALVREFRLAVAGCDAEAIEKAFDMDVLAMRVLAARRRTSTRERAREALAPDQLASAICGDETDRMTYTFLRERAAGQKREAVVRAVAANGNVNYFALEIGSRGGRPRIADVGFYYSGEALSGIFAAYLDAKDDTPADFDPEFWRELSDAETNHDGRAARALIQRLPAALQSWREVIRTEIRIARDAEQLRDLEDATARYAATFASPPPLEIMAVDVAWTKNAYADVVAGLDRLERRLGGDPYLDSIRADAYLHAGDTAKAVQLARRASERAAAVESTWWMRATAQAAAHDFPAAVATLDVLKTRFAADVSASALGIDDRFSALVESPAYQQSGLAQPAQSPQP